jgi:hypothetical protein
MQTTHMEEIGYSIGDVLRVHPGHDVLLGILMLYVDFWQADLLGLLVS